MELFTCISESEKLPRQLLTPQRLKVFIKENREVTQKRGKLDSTYSNETVETKVFASIQILSKSIIADLPSFLLKPEEPQRLVQFQKL
jgi:hypothetical protein